MESIKFIVLFLILFAFRFSSVICDGDHAHAHAASAAASESSPSSHSTGTLSSIHTSVGNGGGRQDTYSSILSSIDPSVIRNLAGNPVVSQYLKASGIDIGAVADAAAGAGGSAAPSPATGGSPVDFDGPGPGGFPGGFGGFPGGYGGFGFPFFGPYKNLHVSGDFGVSYGAIAKKVIIVIGGGILLLVILALLTKGFSKGGLFNVWGTSLSEALAGSASLDFGPFSKSVAGSAAVSANAGAGGSRFGNSPQDLQLTQRVYNGLDQRF